MAETSLAQLAVYMSRYEIDSNLIGRSWDYLRASASKHEQGELESGIARLTTSAWREVG